MHFASYKNIGDFLRAGIGKNALEPTSGEQQKLTIKRVAEIDKSSNEIDNGRWEIDNCAAISTSPEAARRFHLSERRPPTCARGH